jgi:hypothetical protein
MYEMRVCEWVAHSNLNKSPTWFFSSVFSLSYILTNHQFHMKGYLILFFVLYLNQFGRGLFCLFAFTSRFFILNDLFAP